MDLANFFTRVVKHLKKEKIRFAVAGGLIASVYRSNERLTNDLDFLLLSTTKTQALAEKIVSDFKLKPVIIRKADLEGGPMFAIKRNNTTPYMICGRSKENKSQIGLDFILPEMPWFQSALARAENNLIDFGIGNLVPALTVEDVILAKFYAVKNKPQRFQDLDDLQSIFTAGHDLDLAYLCEEMKYLGLIVPKELKQIAPTVLKKIKNL